MLLVVRLGLHHDKYGQNGTLSCELAYETSERPIYFQVPMRNYLNEAKTLKGTAFGKLACSRRG